METVKRAIFIAAGEGSRLRPVTLEIPKPLIEVHGKRMIDQSLEALERQGVNEIYLVVGYKKEKFFEAYRNNPHIHFIENPDYTKGNNITSLYHARDYLPGSFVLEADLVVKEDTILNPLIEKSGYLASWMNPATEWLLTVEENRITNCEMRASRPGYRLWGISMWTQEDGKRLAAEIAREYENGSWNRYWDEVALDQCRTKYDLGIREVGSDAILEIDTLDELVAIDESYKKFQKGQE